MNSHGSCDRPRGKSPVIGARLMRGAIGVFALRASAVLVVAGWIVEMDYATGGQRPWRHCSNLT